MKNEDIKRYIGAVIANPDIGDIEKEVPIAKLLVLVYIAGLQRKDFPFDFLHREIDIEQSIPNQFHTFVAQLAILKSESGWGYRYIDIIRDECRRTSGWLKDYFSVR